MQFGHCEIGILRLILPPPGDCFHTRTRFPFSNIQSHLLTQSQSWFLDDTMRTLWFSSCCFRWAAKYLLWVVPIASKVWKLHLSVKFTNRLIFADAFGVHILLKDFSIGFKIFSNPSSLAQWSNKWRAYRKKNSNCDCCTAKESNVRKVYYKIPLLISDQTVVKSPKLV